MRILFIFLLLNNFCGYSQQKTTFSKDSLAVLDGIILKYNTIEKHADSVTSFFNNKPISVQRFIMNSDITAQTSCMFTRGTFEKVTGSYLIEIALDSNGSIRKQFAADIYNFWNEKDENDLKNYKNVPAKTHLFYANGDYVFYKEPSSNKIGEYYIFYFKNKIMKVSFLGFDNKKGFGGLSSFMSELVQFRFERNQINPKYEMKFDPKLFIELYKKNTFSTKTIKK